MKNLILLLLPLMFANHATAQDRLIDSLQAAVQKEKDPEKKFTGYHYLWDAYARKGVLDSAKPYISELFKIAEQTKSDSLLLSSYFDLASYSDYKTDSKEQIDASLKALKIAERKYPDWLSWIYTNLGSAYSDLQNYEVALTYLRKAEKINLADQHKPSSYLNYLFALDYVQQGKLDSALHYAQQGNEELLKRPNSQREIANSIITGDIYVKMGNEQLAESYYLTALSHKNAGRSYYDAQAACVYGRLLLKQGRLEKAKYYGLMGLQIAKTSEAKKPFLNNVKMLRQVYQSLNQPDSAYYYATLELDYRDSLFNQDKVNTVQDISFKEEIRQREETFKQLEEATERKHNIQYAAIALGVISFLVLFFALSHSIVVNERWVRFFGILALLLVFELINLFIHPYLAHATNDSPLMMLLALVCIAALLIPVHHRVQHWVTHRLVEKNKQIRLAAAKRTIANLEPASSKASADKGKQNN